MRSERKQIKILDVILYKMSEHVKAKSNDLDSIKN